MSSSTSSSRAYLFALILITAGLFAGFLATSEWIIRSKVRPRDRDEDPYAWHLRLFHTGGAKDVAFGDSYMAHALLGLDGFLNLAYPGTNTRLQEVKVKSYFVDRQPRRIILQADPQLFAPMKDEKDISEDLARFAPGAATYSQPTLWLFEDPHRALVYHYWKLYVAREKFGEEVLLLPGGGILTYDSWADVDRAKRLEKAGPIVEADTPARAVASSEAGRAYERMLAFLNDAGARVCMVGMPMSIEYRTLSAAHPEFEDARQFLRALASQYGFQYVDLKAAISDPRLYTNQNHLNAIGGAEFTKLVASTCILTRR